MSLSRICIGGELRKRSSKAVWGAVLALAFWWPSVAAAGPDQAAKLDKALERSTASDEPTAVIIRMKSGREAAVKNKVGRHSGDVQTHDFIRALSVRLTAREIAEFAADPDVDGVSIDADVSAVAAAGNGNTGDSGATKKSGGAGTQTGGYNAAVDSSVVADVKQTLGLGNRFTGSNATVAIIDSGIASSIDFESRIVAQYVFLKGRQYYTVPYDDYGHGTHVAGLIGSSGTTSNSRVRGHRARREAPLAESAGW